MATEWREYREWHVKLNDRQYRVRQAPYITASFVAERLIGNKEAPPGLHGWRHFAYPETRLSNYFGSLAEAQMACEEHAQKAKPS